MEHVVEIGVLGNVYSTVNSATRFRPLCDRFVTACGQSSHQHHGEIIIKKNLNHKTFYV
jgi:hypothetical protein